MTAPSEYLVGTDIGGTFTDLVLLEPGHRPRLFKSPTTPHDRSQGIINALELAADSVGKPLDQFAAQIRYFAHGTTAATNALIERKGTRTGLLTTAGFADTMLIQRSMTSWVGMGAATGHYSRRRNPDPIVAREDIIELPERVDASGAVLLRLNDAEVRSALRRLRDSGVEALAASFLWSFLDPTHELRILEIVEQEWPEVYLTLSHEAAPVIGEYERTATTVINSYLGPVIRDYMENLESRLHQAGFQGELSVMDSGGGVMRASDAARRSASLLTSGPAGGVLATAKLAKALGYANAITSDMGGTSFDVGLILDGEPLVERQSEVGNYHLSIPRIKVTAIGAGGGSIAWVDEVGALVVGPESAGSVPGPACYGRGGARPTVTDADVVLGIIDPGYFLGGRMKLDRALAEEAIRVHIAEPLGMSVEDAALGIRTVADNQMADLLRKVTVEQGRDPRDFAVFAYGGAGPTHACSYTQAAGINILVVPPTSTVHSAYGTVTADRFRALQATDLQRTAPGAPDAATEFDLDRLNISLDDLTARVLTDLDDSPDARFVRSVHLKFRRQTHELPVVLPQGRVSVDVMRSVIEEFFQTYERIYGTGTALRSAGLELNTLRVEGRVSIEALTPAAPVATGDLDAARIGAREVVFAEVGRVEVPVFRGEQVGPGAELIGPAVLEFEGTTIVIGPGQELAVDGDVNIIINCKGN
ncbi:hydantoinase/oxoprolinase family protein [Nocardia noduli]|uniref:hydantoinase/oxoprolinase family protein n=1 Tax=Nocardia noduli TaxID=2815722 RepID=UPI001C242F8E|nr:hydantoinase/oxoprolinase family protein [Nocardia noduli]